MWQFWLILINLKQDRGTRQLKTIFDLLDNTILTGCELYSGLARIYNGLARISTEKQYVDLRAKIKDTGFLIM